MAKKLSEQEKKDWDDLYQYVRKSIFHYDDNQALSRTTCMRLKGLLTGKFLENGKIKDAANYTYKCVLNTFIYKSKDIRHAIETKNFKDESHMINYVFKIVENNINTVYLAMKKLEKCKQEMENSNTEIIEYKGADYKSKSKIESEIEEKKIINKTDKNHKFDDLW